MKFWGDEESQAILKSCMLCNHSAMNAGEFLGYHVRKQSVLSSHRLFFCLQGSYWAIDTNPKEDALPTRPKKRPRSGERVSLIGET